MSPLHRKWTQLYWRTAKDAPYGIWARYSTSRPCRAETAGRFWAVEGLADCHMTVPLHVHSREDELWYVVEGTIRFTIGDETRDAGPGTFAYIPRNVPHTFQILSDTARWFGVGAPGRAGAVVL